ncbi:hypothetical protein F5Y12DRAFT_556282 [Xylaria sp. FL1777]|nr:hypothetical protein F5Y12DRAFT_556282 [Xylaria sp. FL1777]
MTHRAKFISGNLIPARNSRHRIACLALYRALLRLAPQISLPDDLANGWRAGKNPIAIHIERAFRRNLADTSPRLIYPALSAGYRMLSVLHDAATSPAPTHHHASITAFLRSRLAERQRSLANRPPPRPASEYNPKSATPHPDTLPLLVKLPQPPPPPPLVPVPQVAGAADPYSFVKPVYVSPHRPRPQSELGGTGRRKIPHMDLAGDLPFLRLTKPQPAVLSRVIRQKLKRRMERTESVVAFASEGLPDARLEDDWDAEMEWLLQGKQKQKQEQEQGKRQRQRQGQEQRQGPWGSGGGNGSSGDDWTPPPSYAYRRDESSYAYTVSRYGIQETSTVLSNELTDNVARADAMRKLIAEEKALAAMEKARRVAARRTRWEARMLKEHGEAWRELFPNLKESKPVPVLRRRGNAAVW